MSIETTYNPIVWGKHFEEMVKAIQTAKIHVHEECINLKLSNSFDMTISPSPNGLMITIEDFDNDRGYDWSFNTYKESFEYICSQIKREVEIMQHKHALKQLNVILGKKQPFYQKCKSQIKRFFGGKNV